MRHSTLWAAAGVAAVAGCAGLQQLAALRNVQFALSGLVDGRLAGIDLSNVTNYSRLSLLDVGKVAVALARKDLPLEFILNVKAENPAENKVTARMVRMAWSLYLQDKETINGVIDTAAVIAPGQPTMIPMRMRVNLLQFFDGPAQDLVNIAVALAGLNADPTKVSLKAVPTIETPLGPMTYPSPVTIVSRTIGGPAKP
jgi:hypothetical protein